MLISPDVIGVVVAPALAALTEVEGDVVAAPLEVVLPKGFVAALAIFCLTFTYADVVATSL